MLCDQLFLINVVLFLFNLIPCLMMSTLALYGGLATTAAWLNPLLRPHLQRTQQTVVNSLV